MRDIQLSVIIPCYNAETYIEDCVSSLLHQSVKCNYEIIIVNDGSTDKTQQICERLSENSHIVNVIFQHNEGVCSARNKGIQEAKGKFCTFVDADDTVDELYIETILDNISDEVEMIVFAHTSIVRDNKSIVVPPLKTGVYEAKEVLLKNYSKMGAMVWNKVFKTELIKCHKISFPNGIITSEDQIFCYRYYTYVNNIMFICIPLYNYFYRERSRVHVFDLAFFRCFYEAYLEEIKMCKRLSNCPQQPREVDMRFLDRIYWFVRLFTKAEIEKKVIKHEIRATGIRNTIINNKTKGVKSRIKKLILIIFY